MSGKTAATESAKQLSADLRVADDRLQQALRTVSELETSGGSLREELAEARRGAGAVQARLEASVAEGKVRKNERDFHCFFVVSLVCVNGFD